MRRVSKSILKIAILAACTLSGCVSAANDTPDNAAAPPTLQELDERVIRMLTQSSASTGVQGFDGISGRILEYLLVAHSAMNDEFSERCRENPLARHIFFFKEYDDVVRVQTAPREEPDDRPPPPPPPPGYKSVYIIPDLPPGVYSVGGCEIQFTIDKQTKKVTGIHIIR